MHSSKLASLFVLIALALSNAAVHAQPASPLDPPLHSDAVLIAKLDQTAGSPQIARHAETGRVRFIGTQTGQPLQQPNALAATTPEAASRAFLAAYGQLFGLQNPERELQLMQQESIQGRSFVRFQQAYEGVPIIAGELIVQTNQGRAVVTASGEALPDLQLSTVPQVAADVAARRALSEIAKVYGARPADLRATKPELWIFNPALLGGPGPRISRLVWRMEVTPATAAIKEPMREFVLIDAQIGALALHFNQIADAKERHVCDDKNVPDNPPAPAFPDQDARCSTHANPRPFVRSEGQAATGIGDVDLAYDYAGITYDYFFNNFGRDSLDGKGLPLISLVRYCPGACPYQNANWDGHQMTYGAGFASADDVVGHELSHGLTEFTSHLLYYYQSGAINESLSDVFGELIDQTDGTGNDGSGQRWQLGEDMSIGAIRDMKNPPAFGDPDRTGSSNYHGDTSDSGGVHSNSGINNKAAYLMTDGGSFNGQTITGLGAAKVGAIYYTLQVALLTSGSDYQDLYTGLPAACNTLASSGAFGITAANCMEVQKVVKATEMDATPAKAPVPEAPVCPAGQSSQDLFYDDLENPASGNWAASATSGSINEWYYPASNSPYSAVFDGQYATSGTNNLWGNDQGGENGDPGAPADYNIAMTGSIGLPANARLHFRHAFDFEDDGFDAFDGGIVEYSTNGGGSWNDAGPLFEAGAGLNGYNLTLAGGGTNPLAGREAFGSISQGYYSSRADLSSLANQNVRFRFRIGTDSTNSYAADDSRTYYGWFIDDIRIYSCAATVLHSLYLPITRR